MRRSVSIYASRTPGLNRRFDVAEFFRVALVVHVDLSVLVWFVALAGLLWSLNGSARAASNTTGPLPGFHETAVSLRSPEARFKAASSMFSA